MFTNDTTAKTFRSLHSRFKPIYDSTFDDLLAKLEKIPSRKS